MGDHADPVDREEPLVPGWRERTIRVLVARRGISRTVNGIPLRVDPVGRHVFTSIYDEGAVGCLRTHLREGTGRDCVPTVRAPPRRCFVVA